MGAWDTVCPAVLTTVRVLLNPDNEVACSESSRIPRLGFSGGDQEKEEVISFSSRYSPTEVTRHVRSRSDRARTVLPPSQPSLARFPAASGSGGGGMSETVQCLEFQ